jgi:hypothetical protein
MNIQKQQAKFGQSNLDSARRIIQDPRYKEGSLLKLWAVNYLNRHAAESAKREREKR